VREHYLRQSGLQRSGKRRRGGRGDEGVRGGGGRASRVEWGAVGCCHKRVEFDIEVDGVLETGGEDRSLVGLECGFVGGGERRRCCDSESWNAVERSLEWS